MTKSGLMAGLGESTAEVHELRGIFVARRLTWPPSASICSRRGGICVAEYVRPEQFDAYRDYGLEIGFPNGVQRALGAQFLHWRSGERRGRPGACLTAVQTVLWRGHSCPAARIVSALFRLIGRLANHVDLLLLRRITGGRAPVGRSVSTRVSGHSQNTPKSRN